MSNSTNEIIPHIYTESFESGINVDIQILEMNKSLFCYCSNGGPNNMKFSTLALAMPTRFESSAIGTTLFNPSLDATSESVAKRLSTKFKMLVYASIDVPKENIQELETKLIKKIKEILNIVDVQVDALEVGR